MCPTIQSTAPKLKPVVCLVLSFPRPHHNSPLAFAISKLYSEMWSDESGGGGGGRRRAESPAEVIRALVKGNRWFAGNGQHDAHEALRSILDLLHEELRRPVRMDVRKR